MFGEQWNASDPGIHRTYFELPTYEQFVADLSWSPDSAWSRSPPPDGFDIHVFNGFEWTAWTARNWQIPLVAGTIYLLLIPVIRSMMASREKLEIKPVIAAWNFALSAFSAAGVYYTVPHVLLG